MAETEVKQAMLRSAGEVILVADSFKFDMTSLIQVCADHTNPQNCHRRRFALETIQAIESQGVEVIIPRRGASQTPPEEIRRLIENTATFNTPAPEKVR